MDGDEAGPVLLHFLLLSVLRVTCRSHGQDIHAIFLFSDPRELSPTGIAVRTYKNTCGRTETSRKSETSWPAVRAVLAN